MFGRHPDIENIKNVVPRSGSVKIDTKSWPKDKMLADSYTDNPMNINFKWEFWCNIFTDNDFAILEDTYNKASTFASYFYPITPENNQNWISILNKYESNAICKQKFKISIENIIKDIETVLDPDTGQKASSEYKQMLFRILFSIYQDNSEYGTNEWYITGEVHLLNKLKFIAQIARPQKTEVMLYALFKQVMFNCSFKQFFFPCKTIKYNLVGQPDNTFYRYNHKKLVPYQFFKFFFITMLFKIRPHLFIDLSKKEDKFNDAFFSSLVNQADKIYNENSIFPCQTANNANFQRIIGDLIVSKNITSFFAYIMSFWKSNAIKRFNISSLDPKEEVTNIINILHSNPIYSAGYQLPHYNKISSSLVKKKTMKTFVKLGKKSYKPTYKETLPRWKYPRTFFENIVKKLKRSLRRIKRIRMDKKLTLKRRDVTVPVYYPGLKNKNKTVKHN